jgi:hypothetical protein
VEQAAEWLTLTAAAERLGWRLQRVRSLARRQDWPKRKANAGAALEYLTPAGLLAGSPDRPTTGSPDLLPDLLAARERAARAEAALVELRAVLVREQARADWLQAELAEARRPWIMRLVAAVRMRQDRPPVTEAAGPAPPLPQV